MQRAGAGRGAPQDASSGAATGRRGRLGLLLTLALAAHVALVLYAYPLRVVFGELPLGTPDYQTHYHQISTLLAAPPGLGPRDSALDSGAEDSGGLRPDKDCGCASGGAGGGWLLGLLALRRRRYQLTRV